MLSIITGRTIEEADFALRHLGVREFFDSITSVEAQSEPMDKSDVRLLSQVPNVTSFDRILYFGDNISDLQLVQNARHIYPIESVWFVKTLGIMPVSYVKHVQKAYAPSFVARTSIEAVSLVIK
jgi:phosphoglycolate phosphatase-like HAD superfamily hydrolase